MAQVFLSYAREDQQRVSPLVQLLESFGVSVFWDRKVPAGATWREVLNRELTDAICVVVAWSTHSITSEWVLEEADVGKARKQLMPVILELVEPPLGFRNYQAADLTSWTGAPEHWEARSFAATVASRCTGKQPSQRVAARRQRGRQPWLWIGGGLVGGVAIFGGIWLKRHPAEVISTFKSARPLIPSSTTPDPQVPPSASASPQPLNYRRIYFQNFSTSNVEQSVWLVGSRGDWQGQVKEGGYRLCNRSGSDTASFTSALSYSESEQSKTDQSNSKVTVRVRLEPPSSKYSSAGILYRASQESDFYYAFALSAGHSVSFVRKEGKRLKIVGTWELNGFRDGDTAELRVQGAGTEFRLYIGEKLVHTAQDEPMHQGDSGVFAMGLGCFSFDDYSLSLPTP